MSFTLFIYSSCHLHVVSIEFHRSSNSINFIAFDLRVKDAGARN